jgi:geranylgeranyl pyrophosphate synthase
VLYQAVDDVTDLYGDKGRGAPGNDLREGKVSVLVTEHLRLHPGDREALLSTLRLPRAETRPEVVGSWIARFRDGGALAAARERIEGYTREVVDDRRLRAVPDLHAVARELVVMVGRAA